jgi:hypothetical protein
VFIIAAIGLFVVFTNPTYQASKDLQTQVASYDDALNKSQELRSVRDQLLSKRNTFSPDDVQKVTAMLPDNVDNIRLIIDINNIASRHNLALKNVQLGTVGAGTHVSTGPANSVGSVDIGFTVNASYDTMLAFLQDLEHSLRLIDVEKLAFNASAITDYSFTIRTYWLH